MPLPAFVAPMLATLVDEPFDSERHHFEVKWDGIRALGFAEGGTHRLLSRNRQDLTPSYPDIESLARLPDGTLLDGELVTFEGERPSFARALERVQARQPLRARALARSSPSIYVVFDLLYRAGEPELCAPLRTRRARLEELVASARDPRLVLSEGIPGAGRAFFAEIERRGLEGMVAKELDGAYLVGRRTRSWLKVKTRRSAPCAILGYVADERGDVSSLVIALEEEGRLACAGRVGSGLTDELRARLLDACRARERETPFLDGAEASLLRGEKGVWVEPGLFCRVSFTERTENGLRAPVFVELLEQR